jgi:NAD(P)-dependent dehydrogenase (short-subunit alcohol dehydrogenase family)
MTRCFYALMRGRKAGVIVHILGAAGEKPDFEYIAGSSGNASLMAFTRAMGGTAPRDGLRVVGINPGPVMTERLVGLMRTRAETRFGNAERWPELMTVYAFGRAASPRRSLGWRPFSPPTDPATRRGRSSRSMAAAAAAPARSDRWPAKRMAPRGWGSAWARAS